MARLARGGCRPLQPTRPTPHWHRRQAFPPAGFGLLPVRSPLLGESSLFLGVLRCFSSPGALPRIAPRVPGRAPGGLPHSEIPGSQAASASPGHFAAWPRPSSAADAKASTMRPSYGFPPSFIADAFNPTDAEPARARRRRVTSSPPARSVPAPFGRCWPSASAARPSDPHRLPRPIALAGHRRCPPCDRSIDSRRTGPAHRAAQSIMFVMRAVRADGQARMPGIGLEAAPSTAAEPGGLRVAHCQSAAGMGGVALWGWARLDSNQGPRPYQGRALTT